MPYEALSDNIYSYKSDIWAIGVIFYEMLTGKTPWRAKTESDLKRQLKSTPIKNILPSNIGKSSSDFLIKSLTLDAENRMTPEEMCFFFEKSSDLDMAIQPKRLVSNNRIGTHFKTRAVSQDRSSRND
jgi:serine/threonine protein kinase